MSKQSTICMAPCNAGEKCEVRSGDLRQESNVGASAVKLVQSSEPELKNGSLLCDEEVEKLTIEYGRLQCNIVSYLLKTNDPTNYVITEEMESGNLIDENRLIEVKRILAEYRIANSVVLPSENRLTAYAQILFEEDEITDGRFYTEEETAAKHAELVARMCPYHCHEGVIGKITPAQTVEKKHGKKVIKKFWEAGCAWHDHGDSRYPCDKVHFEEEYENETLENTQQNRPQTETESSVAVCRQENRDEVSSTLTTCSTNGNVPRDMSKTASNEPTGLCLGSNIGAGGASEERGQHESDLNLGSVTRKDKKRLEFISRNKDNIEKKDQINDTINDLLEESYGDEYFGEEEEKEQERQEEDHRKKVAIEVEEKFKTFRMFEQRTVFWDSLSKSIEGRMKPLNGELMSLMYKLRRVTQEVQCICNFKRKKYNDCDFEDIAVRQKKIDVIMTRVAELKNIYDGLMERYDGYCKNWKDSLDAELQCMDEIEELMPGRIIGDPEKGIPVHIYEDRASWMMSIKLNVMDEVAKEFLGRPMTVVEEEDLKHSLKILMEHLEKFDRVIKRRK